MKRITVTIKDNLTGETNEFEMENLFMFGEEVNDEFTYFAHNITFPEIADGVDSFSADHPEFLRAQVAGSINRIIDRIKTKLGGK